MKKCESNCLRPEKFGRLSDGQLLNGFYAGDAAALGELSTRLRDRLVRIAQRQLPDNFPARWHTAEDLVAQVFLKVVATRDRLHTRRQENRGEVMPWISRILRNEIASLLRSKKSWQRTGLDSILNGVPEGRYARTDFAASRASDGELIGQVSQAAQGLPGELREVVYLKYKEGRTQGAISSRLGISKATVSRRLESARERLRHACQNDENRPTGAA